MEIIGLLKEEPLVAVALKNKIKSFITPDLYRDLDDFIKDNPTFEDFKKRAKFNEAYKRALNWGAYDITEEQYQTVLAELKNELGEKMRIEKEKITTVNAKGKEVATYQREDGSVIAVDNSYNNKPIAQQLEEIQKKYSKFRRNSNTNTENLMEHMQDEIKPELEFQAVSNINSSELTDEQNQMAVVAEEYQDNANNQVTVNLDDGLILDNGNVLSIEQIDDGYAVVTPEEATPEEIIATKSSKSKEKTKTKQKTLGRRLTKQTGFSDAILLALLSGSFIALMLVNLFVL